MRLLSALALSLLLLPACAKEEDCTNGTDDDDDGWVDCEDQDCDGECDEDCEDARDNDGDGDIDCWDDDCLGVCPEVCDNDEDDDGDGATDCEDDDCDGGCPEVCDDVRDNDGDGFVDCWDSDCDGGCDEVCWDERDNDGDELIDCEDDDCDGGCPEDCDDTRDNDGDGDVDCADVECDGTEHGCPEVCDDGRDNDGDGLLDCEDGDCTDCEEEVCDDGLDDDADGMIDCADDDCWGNGCAATVATLKGGSASVNRTVVDFYHYGWDSMFYTVSGAKTTSFWFTAGEHLTLVAAGIDLSGTVVQYPTTGAAALCTWTVDHGNLMMLEGSSSGFYSGYGGHYPYFDNTISHFNLRRGNFLIGGACTLSTSGFLPQRLTIEPTYLGLPGEGLWYGGSATGLVVSSDTHRIDHHINPSYFKYYSTVNAAWNIPELLTSDPWVVHD